jgi:hypothetical protein
MLRRLEGEVREVCWGGFRLECSTRMKWSFLQR